MNLLVLPVIIPLMTSAACVLAWQSKKIQRFIAFLGGLLHLVSACFLLSAVRSGEILVLEAGSWKAPFGIVFAADVLGALMVLLTAIIGFAALLYSFASTDRAREFLGYYPVFHVLIAGVSGAFLTGDIFNLYVWFEVMLMSSFVLMALGADKEGVQASIKYVILSLISSTLFLAACGILYGIVGTLNYADLSQALRVHPQQDLVRAVGILFLASFGIKAAVFPVFFWLPASYHTPPMAVSGMLAGLLTKVGVYAIIRLTTLIFIDPTGQTQDLLLFIAGVTMISGVLGAIAQHDVRKILSFHIISQIGYMIMGAAIHTPLALAGTVFYIAHHIIVKTNLFFIAGIIARLAGGFDLKKIGGLYKSAPALALLFAVPAFSLAGIPPLSGFFAKFILVKAGLQESNFILVSVSLLCGVLTLFSMTKIWNEAFWKKPTEPLTPRPAGFLRILPAVSLALMTVVIGALSGPLFDLAREAGNQLMTPERYIEAVLGTL